MARRKQNLLSKSSRIPAAAAGILDEHAVDITQPVVIDPLARELMARVGCARETARRHIAHQIRLRRGEMSVIGTHGGARAQRPTIIDGVWYESRTAAARALGVTPSTISYRMRRHARKEQQND